MRVQIEPFNAIATGVFLLAILHTFAAARFTASRTPGAAPPRRGSARARPAGVAEPARRRSLHFLGRSRGRLRLVGRGARWSRSPRTPVGRPRSTTSATRSTTRSRLFVVVIMALASTRPIIGFAEAALRRVARLGGAHTGGVVGRDPDCRSGAGLVHHRARGDDDLRPAPRTAVLRPATDRAAEVRDPRRAVRQRLDRRHADPVRGAAGADGGAPVGMGHPVHGRELRLARRRWPSLSRRRSTSSSSGRSCASSRPERPIAEVEQPDDEARGSALLPVPPWVVAVHLAFMAWTVFNAHYPALFLGGFLFFLGIRAGHLRLIRAASS